MQSRPIEVQQNESVENLPQESVPSAQHGLQNDVESFSNPPPNREAGEDSVQPHSGDADASSVSSGSRRGRKPHIRRLKSHESSSHGGSPVNRIEEYERSHHSSPRRGDAMAFQVIPSVKGVRRHISVEQFPNGELACGKLWNRFNGQQRSSPTSSLTYRHQPCRQ
jgi:hypothetical protein